jgi:hypothetical protein
MDGRLIYLIEKQTRIAVPVDVRVVLLTFLGELASIHQIHVENVGHLKPRITHIAKITIPRQATPTLHGLSAIGAVILVVSDATLKSQHRQCHNLPN